MINHKEEMNMARFKITATATITLVREISASTREEAESIFYDGTYQDIVKNANKSYITSIKTNHVEKTFVDHEARATEIEYDLDEEDRNLDLPKELVLWVMSDASKDHFKFDYATCKDMIEDEVGLRVKSFKYEVLE